MRLCSIHETAPAQNKPGKPINFEFWQVLHELNLRHKYADALLAMAEVEGTDQNGNYNDATASAWLESQDRDSNYSAKGVLKHLLEIYNREMRCVVDDPDHEYDGMTHVGTIYGAGGWNRWYVYLNGIIKFSIGHATSKAATSKAIRLGFGTIG